MKKISGYAASPGIAIGPVFQFKRSDSSVTRSPIENVVREEERVQQAIATAKDEIHRLQLKIGEETNRQNADIFAAHEIILSDPELINLVLNMIRADHINAEAAFQESTEYYAKILEGMENEYFQARAVDVRDISSRVIRILSGNCLNPVADLIQPSIIVAKDLTPSDTVSIEKSMVLAFCTVTGGTTSHAAILARSLGIPAIVGIEPSALDIPNGTPAIVTGDEGILMMNPTEETLYFYQTRRKYQMEVLSKAGLKKKEPAITEDGCQVEVVANIGNIESASRAVEAGAEGVGLLRTEFLYLDQESAPTEEEQYQAYRQILNVFGQMPVVLRTLDIGGDKPLSFCKMPVEMNPFLGVRAIRFCLNHLDLFKPQLKAALRAGVNRNLRIMFPMIALVDEFRRAREIVTTCREELKAEGIPSSENVELGIMVEIPSAAIMADEFAKEVDFFSIGTNDLTQYTLAVDRTNADLSYLANAFHPAVLRLIRGVIKAAHQEGKWVGLCGELAGEALAIPILLGLGLDEFSMNPPAIPLAKQIIRQLTLRQTQEVARNVLHMDRAEEIQNYIKAQFPFISA